MAEAKLRCDPTCSTLSAMADRPNPVFRTIEEVSLIGTMATYDSQAEASQGIPQQWRAFRLAHPALESSSKFYGASPCTGDRKIHYLTGVAYEGPDGVVGGERLTLEAGEYAVIHVNDTALLRDTWTWLLGHWLATPDVERRTHQSLSDLPAYRKPVHPLDRSKSGFPSNHFREIESALAAPDRR